MKKGQRIRLRPSVRAAQDWGITNDAEGVVLCRYVALSGPASGAERVDVKFGPQTIVWGAPANAFVEIDGR